MAQTIISAKCTDQILTVIDSPTIAAGGIDEDKISFEFCPLWDGFTKKVIFQFNKTITQEVDVAEDNTCVIPAEVIAQPGYVFFGVYGTNAEGVRRTSTVIKYNIAKGAVNLL